MHDPIVAEGMSSVVGWSSKVVEAECNDDDVDDYAMTGVVV